MKSNILLLTILAMLLTHVVNAAPKVNHLVPVSRKIVLPVIYVKADATGANNGNSWTDAYTNLQTAITAASAGVQIWVAAATYKPVSGQSFGMKEGVKIYGGFAGTETLLGQRNWQTNLTKLQGNGNSVIRNDNNGLTTAALLDGFTITDGNASGVNGDPITPAIDGNGGGMYNNNVSPSIYNCIFLNNMATGGNSNSSNGARGNGGAIYNSNASPLVVNCVFSGNRATGGNGLFNGGNGNGGAVFNDNSNAVFVNVVMYNNFSKGGSDTDGFVTGAGLGGAVSTDYGSPKFINIVVYGNSSGMTHLLSAALITNSIIIGNNSNNLVFTGTTHTVAYSYVQGGYTGTGNISAGPLFVNAADPDGADNIWGTADDGLRLQVGSRAVNAGNNNALLPEITIDLGGNDRIQDLNVDMGAYEQSPTTLPVHLIVFTAKAENNAAKLQWQTASAVNNREFVIYRLNDQHIASKIGVVKPNVDQDYTFYDRQPLNGNNYYSLVQVDNDGKTTELGTKQVSFKLQESTFFLYPNPASDKVYLKGTATGNYQLYNSVGQQISNGSTTALINGLDISGLQPGIYYVQLDGKSYKLLKP